jgi:hypothetical protein
MISRRVAIGHQHGRRFVALLPGLHDQAGGLRLGPALAAVADYLTAAFGR